MSEKTNSEILKPIKTRSGGTWPPASPIDRGVFISTYGCQMNVADSERMYAVLEMQNYTQVPSADLAEVIIINSCSVREKPVHKVYSEVGSYRVLKGRNPKLKIGVGGCVGSQEKGNLTKKQPLIDFVFGTDNIDELPEILAKLDDKYKKVIQSQFHHRTPYHIQTMVTQPGVAQFVNITKGCDNFCTFCVVPFTRGREKSRPLQHVLKDFQDFSLKGTKEITLLGQNVNSYKSECGADFADLLEILSRETDLLRIRFTTSHPKDFDQKLVDVMARYQSKLCEYIHLPFQSGNSRVLEMMNRGYTREEYLQKVAMIRAAIPGVVLSTDIIVGFPSETEAEFQDTMSLVEEGGFETIFAFMYSPRPMTKAASFESQLPEDVKSERLQRLFAHHEALADGWVKKYEGQTLQVLVEKFDQNRSNWVGRSTQNKLVYFAGDQFTENLIGQVCPILISKARPSVFRGDLVKL